MSNAQQLRVQHDSNWFRRERERFKQQGRLQNAPCWLCGQPIDYDAPPRDPNSHTLDHLHPVSIAPELHDDKENWRHAHWGCNAKRGNKPVTKQNSVLPRWW